MIYLNSVFQSGALNLPFWKQFCFHFCNIVAIKKLEKGKVSNAVWQKFAVAIVLMAIQGKLTNLSGQNLTYPPERKEGGKGKKTPKLNKPKQTKTQSNQPKQNKKS